MPTPKIYRLALSELEQEVESQDSEQISMFLSLEMRLLENLRAWETTVDNLDLKSARYEIIQRLNDLASNCGLPTFNRFVKIAAERSSLERRRNDYEELLSVVSRPPSSPELTAEAEILIDIIRQINDLNSRMEVLDSPSREGHRVIMNIHYAPTRPDFFGRAAELNEVIDQAAQTSRASIIVVQGSPGVGKTSLAVEAAYQLVENEVVDTVVWLSARPAFLDATRVVEDTPQVNSIEQFLTSILYAFDVQPEDNLSAMYLQAQRELSARRVLLILDNFDTVADPSILTFLRNRVPSPSRTLITSRTRLSVADYVINLDQLPFTESSILLRREGQQKDVPSIVEAEPSLLKNIWKWSSGLPLAMRWFVGIASVSALSAMQLFADIHDHTGDVEQLLNFLFSDSYALLGNQEKTILHASTVFASDSSEEALSASADVPKRDFRKSIRALYGSSLLEYDDVRQRYSLLPITREFLSLHSSTYEIDSFRENLARYFAEWLNELSKRLSESIPVARDIVEDRENIIDIIEWAYETERWELVLAIGKGLTPLLDFLGYYQDRYRTAQFLFDAAHALGNIEEEIWILIYELSWVEQHIGKRDQARTHLHEAIALAEEHDFPKHSALARRNLALVEYRQGINSESEEDRIASLEVAEEALRKAREDWNRIPVEQRDKSLLALLLRTEAHIIFAMGNLSDAEKNYRQVIEIFSEIGAPDRGALSLSDLGIIAMKRGDLVAAKQLIDESIKIGERHDSKFLIARNYQRLAYLFALLEDWPRSIEWIREAISIYEDIGANDAASKATDELQLLLSNDVPALTV